MDRRLAKFVIALMCGCVSFKICLYSIALSRRLVHVVLVFWVYASPELLVRWDIGKIIKLSSIEGLKKQAGK